MSREKTRFVACLDTESVNVPRLTRSLPVSYQLGLNLSGVSEKLEAADVRTSLDRNPGALYRRLDEIIDYFDGGDVTPVVGVHNLAYDLHFIMPYIRAKNADGYDVECCFKSSVKPLTVVLKKSDENVLIFWDTLSFSGKSLKKMGEECGYLKKDGDWDYDLTRHARTKLSDEEVGYALADVVVPFMWLKWWHGLNPDIPLDKLAMPIMTKTSIVRYKCKSLGESSFEYGEPIYKRFLDCCSAELPKTEVDYNLMIRSTSAGWTFTAGRNAGRLCEDVLKYDATSMHPSHMVSHLYPYNFEVVEDSAKARDIFSEVVNKPLDLLLCDWRRPFEHAFNARVLFVNLRPKEDSIFARDDLMLHGSALFHDYETDGDGDTESSDMEFNAVNRAGYANIAINPVYSFGKLVSADMCVISLNELNAWVHAQVYDWSDFTIFTMSATDKYRVPPTYVRDSVSAMLNRKKMVKDAMHGDVPYERPDWVPEAVYEQMIDGGGGLLDSFYKQVKSDLNSLYGMFATNEAKQRIIYDDGSLHYDGNRGFDNLPSKPKAWYNFGLRIAAWSRVQQCCAMLLLDVSRVAKSFVNGDTDSFAFRSDCGEDDVIIALAPLHSTIAGSTRTILCIPSLRDTVFDGLGLYMEDCKPSKYCAVANKRYAYTDSNDGLHVASAGVPNLSVEYAIGKEIDEGKSFNEAVIYALGYMAEYGESLSGAKYKSAPEYGEELTEHCTITDYRDTDYTYPIGTPVGIFLADTVKCLGLGFDDDYRRCLENGGVEYRHIHAYYKE